MLPEVSSTGEPIYLILKRSYLKFLESMDTKYTAQYSSLTQHSFHPLEYMQALLNSNEYIAVKLKCSLGNECKKIVQSYDGTIKVYFQLVDYILMRLLLG